MNTKPEPEVQTYNTLDYFRAHALYYDAACAADTKLVDAAFYLDAAKAAKGRVLEVGCGTGRVLLPIARAGVAIDGLDFSPEFLAILKKKLEQETPEMRSRVSLYEGDMRNFSLPGTYDLITVPFRPLQHLHTVDEQLAAFRCFHRHLNSGGRLAFNVFYPDFRLLDEIGSENLELEWTDPADPSVTVRRYFLRKSVDRLNQFFEGDFIYRSYRGEKVINEDRSNLKMSFYTYPQILLLFRSAGFTVKAEYGSYAAEPISVCKEMIFVAEKKTLV